MLPACVKTCPTGAMNFGDRDVMLEMANKRLEQVKKLYPKAQLLNADFHQTVYLVLDDPQKYHKHALNLEQEITRIAAIKKIFRHVADLIPLAG